MTGPTPSTDAHRLREWAALTGDRLPEEYAGGVRDRED